MQIQVVDQVMGAGKTSAIINMINDSDDDTRFIYITPYLTEVTRIKEQCLDKNFKEPQDMGTKLRGLKYLLKNKINIVSTHALFQNFDDEAIALAYENNYILIMDEVADVIAPYKITSYDLEVIFEKYVHIDDGYKMVWDDVNYDGKFNEIKHLCELGCMGYYNNQIILWLFPIKTFEAFNHIYILTYMFSGQMQKYYYDYYNVKYEYLYVKNENNKYLLTNEKQKTNSIYNYSELIQICDKEAVNRIGDTKYSLSTKWYKASVNNGLLIKLKNNCCNYFKNIAKSKSQNNLWTTFKDYQKQLSGKGYSKGFIPLNLRATNEYRDRNTLAYLVNRFMNPNVKNFFTKNKIVVDEDSYALSEMLQWLWRGAIRDGNPINVYIPSKRMRDLLIKWIEEQELKEDYNND